MSEAIDRVLTEGTYDAVWCPSCGMFAPGPWPISIPVEMHDCREVTS